MNFLKRLGAHPLQLMALGVAALLGLGAFLFAGGRNEASADEAMSREEVEKIVREYILENPELLLEAMDVLEARRDAARLAQAQAAIAEYRDAILNDGFSHVMGNPNGDVTVVEYFDYNCPYCRRVQPELLKLIEADPNVRVILKEYPVLGDQSVVATNYSVAALAQGPEKYLALHNALLASDEKLNETLVLAIAAQAGLDVDQLKRDVQSPLVAERVAQLRAEGEAIGIGGTPTFIIGDIFLPGYVPLDGLQAAVADTRAKQGQTP
ncbi:MAG TPA: DsbA family protein [Micropepsaceae bacterium]|nr:DsbA family protein [Micropepsaceae bacterium]